VVEKPNRSLRLCLDPQALNKYIVKDSFLIPTYDEIFMKLRDKKYFTTLDLKNGFYQIELSDKSKELCSFNTPFGVYSFQRLPFGVSTAAEVFQRYNTEVFGDIDGVCVYIDDLLISSSCPRQHDRILTQVIERAKKNGIKFNKEKVQYKVDKVKFLGHIVSAEGISIDDDRVRAIEKMKDPRDRKELERFLGVVNYVRTFVPLLSDMTAPLRELTKRHVIFNWSQVHSEAVRKIKECLVNSCKLTPFSPQKDIVILTDSSKDGIGCCLMQDKGPVAYASRSLSDCEKNYSQIEKEFLSAVYACKKFHYWVYGRPITIKNDHKPLEALMKKDILKIPSSRLQKMRLKLLNYDVDFEYLPGKFQHIADYLSRNFIETGNNEEDRTFIDSVHTINVSSEKQKKLVQETIRDPILSMMRKRILDGWPHDKSKVEPELRFYFKLRNDLFLEGGLLFFNDRILIPTSMRVEMLAQLHEVHFGISKTQRRARELLYWPGMNRDVEDMILKCDICQSMRPGNSKEPLISHEIPDRAFVKIASDIAEVNGKSLLVTIDYFSKWIEVSTLKNKSSGEVKRAWLEIFSRFGIPNIIIADNVPFNSFECREFSKEYGFIIETSSPLYPRSNGLAERAVQIVKNIYFKSGSDENRLLGLMEYRSTPTKDMCYSPAQLVQNRRLKTKLPIKENLLMPRNLSELSGQFKKKAHNSKKYYDKNCKDRKPFEAGDKIRILKNKKWIEGEVIRKHHTPRSYIVRDKDDVELRRNSYFLKKRH
jgi:hypothetical protein